MLSSVGFYEIYKDKSLVYCILSNRNKKNLYLRSERERKGTRNRERERRKGENNVTRNIEVGDDSDYR